MNLPKPFRIYVGWDQRSALAFEVCVLSLREHASVPIEVIPLKEWPLRRQGIYWRPYHVDQHGQMWDNRDGTPFSTDFSFTRFCVPLLEDFAYNWCMFLDADMLWRGDVAELFALIDEDKAVMCVKHLHEPDEPEKMDRKIQSVYDRKNWSSVMLLNPGRCRELTPYRVNNGTRNWLHGMCWVQDGMTEGLPEEWNWLQGWSAPEIDPKLVHFIRGTPDFPGYADSAYADEWHSYARRIIGGEIPLALFDNWLT